MSPSSVPETPQTTAHHDPSPRERVLCAVDDDAHALDVIATGAHLAAAGRVDLLFVHVATITAYVPIADGGIALVTVDHHEELRRDARERGHHVLRRLGLGGAQTHVAVGVWPARAIRTAAITLGAAMVVMGPAGGGGLRHMGLPSVTRDLLRDAPFPVVVARHDAQLAHAEGPVLATLAGAGRSPWRGFRWGARLASLLDRQLVIACLSDPGGRELPAAVASEVAADAIVVLDRPGRAARLEALAGDMEAAVLALPYGRGPFERAFGLGRLARRLASRCPAPVAVLPTGAICRV